MPRIPPHELISQLKSNQERKIRELLKEIKVVPGPQAQAKAQHLFTGKVMN